MTFCVTKNNFVTYNVTKFVFLCSGFKNSNMEMENLNKSAFSKLAATISGETYQIVREGDTWYEQLNDDEVVYRHKLLTIKNVSLDSLNKKAKSCHNDFGRIIDPSQGSTCAFIFKSNAVLYYCLLPIFKTERNRAMQLVEAYAKHLATNKKTKFQACAALNKAA